MLNNTDISDTKIPKELECVWKGKNKTTLPIYTPVAEKTKGAFVGSLYEKSSATSKNPAKQNSRWLGKLGMANPNVHSKNTLSISKMRRGTNRDAVKEKIASDFYYLLACASDLAFDVPKARLAELPIMNPYTEKNELAKFILEEMNQNSGSGKPVTHAIHIMSKWVNGYQDLAEAKVCNTQGMIVPYLTHLKETGCLSDTIFVKDKIIPLTGLLELLAAARLLGDVDVLGNGGTNTGFIVQEDLRGTPISAKIVKIDPGFVFTVNEQESLLFATLYPPSNPITRRQLRTLKDIKDMQIGTSTDILVHWSSLTNNQKSRFLKTLQGGMNLLKQKTIVNYLFSRDEKFNAHGDHPLMTEEIIGNYTLNLELLLEMQEKAYGDLFNEIIADDKQKIQELTEILHIEKEALKNKDLIITSKEQIISTKDQQLQIKENELTTKNSTITSLELEIVELRKSLQMSQNEITKDLAALLKWVTEGHLIEVENLLKKNPNLAHMTGTVTDLSDRTFKDITVFQYAAWALDMKMCEVILKYLDNASALTQLQSLEAAPEKYSQYGAHYDITPLVTKTREYLDNFSQKDDEWDSKKREQHWQKEVGGAQKQCPAWLIYAWCEKGDDAAWVKKDLASIQFTRQYDQDFLKWWFTEEYNGGKGVGSNWAGARGKHPWCCQGTAMSRHGFRVIEAQHDLEVSVSVGRESYGAVKNLKTDLENSFIRNDSSIAFKSGSVINTTELQPQFVTPQITNSKLIINDQEQKEKIEQGLNQNSIFTYKQDASIKTNTIIPKDQQTKKDLAALLKWVTEGHLIEVENLLKKNPNLAHMTGAVTDLSGRTFKDITVFQYAAWALDMKMCEVILKYLDNASALTQLQSLESYPEKYSRYGAHYDITPLVTKTREYLDNYSQWNNQKCEQHWQKEVGGAQRQCPAWLIYAWCEKGDNAAWVKKDLANIQFTRQYEKDLLKWWFTEVYNDGAGVGSTWAAVRGDSGAAARVRWFYVMLWDRSKLVHDLEVSLVIERKSHEAAKNLKTDLENSLIRNDSNVVFKSGSVINTTELQPQQFITPQVTNSQLIINNQEQKEKIQQGLNQNSIFTYKQDSSINTNTNIINLNNPKIFIPKDEPTKKDLAALLKWVTEGYLIEVKKLLQKNPDLALMTGTVTDLSDRTFNNITVFQYAVWAVDIEMCNVILKYLDKPSALSQLQLLETNPKNYSPHGAHYDITPLLTKTKEYIDNYEEWNIDKCKQHWQKEVGGAQRQCPAWLIYAWCEEGKNVAWIKKDLVNTKVTRQYEKAHSNWWFTKGHNGSSWACVRGAGGRFIKEPRAMWALLIARQIDGSKLAHDYQVNQSIRQICHETLSSLKTSLENPTINTNDSMSFK